MSGEAMVEHDRAKSRFVIRLEGREAFLSYRQEGTELDLQHTFVPDAFRGRGLAERLCQAAFEHAKAGHLTVIPTCPYISGAYLKRHPEHLSLVKA